MDAIGSAANRQKAVAALSSVSKGMISSHLIRPAYARRTKRTRSRHLLKSLAISAPYGYCEHRHGYPYEVVPSHISSNGHPTHPRARHGTASSGLHVGRTLGQW